MLPFKTACILHWLVLLILVFFVRNEAASNVPLVQVLSLQSLYNSTNGTNWKWKNSSSTNYIPWNFSQSLDIINPCLEEWQGIVCDDDCDSGSQVCNITEISLSGFGLVGTLPNDLDSIASLKVLDLGYNISIMKENIKDVEKVYDLMQENSNNIRGTIPDTLGNLKQLQVLDLSTNQLSGTVPDSFAALVNLEVFYLFANRLKGSIPSSIYSMAKLRILNIGFNNFGGSIPSDPKVLASLVRLERFFAPACNLTGVIPTSIQVMTNLQMLGLGDNNLSGGLPPLTNMSNLLVVELFYNYFRGTIPTVYGTVAPDLKVLSLWGNYLTGTIPGELGNLTNLQLLNLAYNYLTSSIPASLADITALVECLLNNNHLNGTLPQLISSFSLQSLQIGSNSLSGSLPSSLSSLISLTLLDVSSNLFTGNVDNYQLPNLDNMVSINFQNNHFSGRFPSLCDLGNGLVVYHLQELLLSFNEFSGSIPQCIGDIMSLSYLSFSENSLTGTLPTSMALMDALVTVDLSSNAFSGKGIANILGSESLKTINVFDNLFTGGLPVGLFQLSNLVALSASKNCFTQAIPDDICSVSNLQFLDLSVLRGGCEAGSFLWRLFAPTTVGSTIPECLFTDLKMIETLSLSGNGLTGTIPEIPEDTSLVNISLAHNRLSGTIPNSIQAWQYKGRLDLSSNRFRGSIRRMTGVANVTSEDSNDGLIKPEDRVNLENYLNQYQANFTGVLSIKGNRLTGKVPSQLGELPYSISILNGNMFECLYENSLPANDSYRSSYVCGSNTLYAYLCVFSAVFGMGLLYFLFTFIKLDGCSQPNKSDSSGYHASVSKSKNLFWVAIQYASWRSDNSVREKHVDDIADIFTAFRVYCAMLGVIIVAILVPTYMSLKSNQKYSTHEYQYGWLISAAQLQGILPAFVLMATWTLAIVCIVLYTNHLNSEIRCLRNARTYNERPSVGESSRNNLPQRHFSTTILSNCGIVNISRRWKIRTLVLLDIAFVITIYFLYVQLLMSDASVYLKHLASIIIATGKSVFSESVLIPLLQQMSCEPAGIIALLIFHDIVAPFLASCVSDISCFYDLWHETFSTLYVPLTLCEQFNFAGACVHPSVTLVAHQVRLPFIYSDQCSSAMMVSFVPILLVSFGIVQMVVEILKVVVLYLFGNVFPYSDYGSFKHDRDSADELDETQHLYVLTSKRAAWVQYIKTKNVCGVPLLYVLNCMTLGVVAAESLPIQDLGELNAYAVTAGHEKESLYHLDIFGITNSVSIAVLLIYGIMYPLLGGIIVVTLLLRSIVMQLSIHSHYLQVLSLSNSEQRGSDVYLDHKWTDILAFETEQLKMASFGRRSVAILGSCFFALAFVFDTSSQSHSRSPFHIGVGICFSLVLVRLIVGSYRWLYPSQAKREQKARRVRNSGSIDLFGSQRISTILSYANFRKASNASEMGLSMGVMDRVGNNVISGSQHPNASDSFCTSNPIISQSI